MWQEESRWPNLEDQVPDITNEDREVKAVVSVHVVNIGGDVIAELVSRISSWNKLLGVMAFVLKFVKKMKSILERSTDDKKSKNLTVEDMEYARIVVLQHYQRIEFKEVYRILDEKERYSRKLEESIGCLNPYIDVNGLVRVGGRLRQAELEEAVKHPILLPKKGHLTELIVRWCHEKTAHSGRNMTLTEIRSSGYWVMQGNSVVKWLISKCVTCRRLRGKVGEQIMADLPPDRTKEEPPFTYCGVDMFGPFEIKERRTILKRYGALFTCLASRGIHIEMTKSMETDSFILALRRFIARRGSVRSIRCDNGGNFVGAKHELARCIEEMDHNKIREFMLKQNADWIYWKMNPPLASHMGGVWERQIRSARAILSSILKTHSTSLDDESLNTLFTEVEAIVNSRPLVVETINDANSEVVLSPTNLLTMKSKVVMPPPGEFSRPDIYCRKRWRRVQHLSNEFWSRWRKEFLLSLQERQKWSSARRNFREGDIVILKDDNCRRNEWKLAKIVETFPDEKGFVRTVKLLVSSIDRSGSMDNRMFVRPVDKMVLLVEADEVRSPTREPSS